MYYLYLISYHTLALLVKKSMTKLRKHKKSTTCSRANLPKDQFAEEYVMLFSYANEERHKAA